LNKEVNRQIRETRKREFLGGGPQATGESAGREGGRRTSTRGEGAKKSILGTVNKESYGEEIQEKSQYQDSCDQKNSVERLGASSA